MCLHYTCVLPVFDASGVDLGLPVMVTCLTGMTSCAVAGAAHILGKENVPVYYVRTIFHYICWIWIHFSESQLAERKRMDSLSCNILKELTYLFLFILNNIKLIVLSFTERIIIFFQPQDIVSLMKINDFSLFELYILQGSWREFGARASPEYKVLPEKTSWQESLM